MTQKKLLLILISVIVTIGVLCALTAGREVSLKPEHDTYPVGTTTVSATFRNAFPGQYHTDRKYVLEKFDGGTWVPIKKDAQGAFFEDDGFSPSFLTKITFDLTQYSDGLTEGQYRIRKTMYTKENTPFNIEFHFSVE